jgi:hypothetical protein
MSVLTSPTLRDLAGKIQRQPSPPVYCIECGDIVTPFDDWGPWMNNRKRTAKERETMTVCCEECAAELVDGLIVQRR